jgi:Na+/alanine symporter
MGPRGWFHVYNTPQMDSVLSQVNPVHTLLLQVILILFSIYRMLSQVSLLKRCVHFSSPPSILHVLLKEEIINFIMCTVAADTLHICYQWKARIHTEQPTQLYVLFIVNYTNLY